MNDKELNPIKDSLTSSSEILDLGCGAGRNSIYFAEENVRVTSVDVDKTSLMYLNYKSKANNLNLSIANDDVLEYLRKNQFKGKFDAVLMVLILNYFSEEDYKELVRLAQLATKVGGFNYVKLFCSSNNSLKDNDFKSYIEKGDIDDLYLDWDLSEHFYGETSHNEKLVGYTFTAEKTAEEY